MSAHPLGSMLSAAAPALAPRSIPRALPSTTCNRSAACPRIQDELVEVLQSGVHLVTNLVQDILDLEAIESGKFALRSEPTDVRAMVSRVARRVRSAVRG